MNAELLQGTIDLIFKGNLLYLSPILLILFSIIFADRITDLITTAIEKVSTSRRRY